MNVIQIYFYCIFIYSEVSLVNLIDFLFIVLLSQLYDHHFLELLYPYIYVISLPIFLSFSRNISQKTNSIFWFVGLIWFRKWMNKRIKSDVGNKSKIVFLWMKTDFYNRKCWKLFSSLFLWLRPLQISQNLFFDNKRGL